MRVSCVNVNKTLIVLSIHIYNYFDDLLELISSIIKQETYKLILFWKFRQLKMQLEMEIKQQDWYKHSNVKLHG